MELWELVAREQVRSTMATYNWSGDSLRLDDLLGAFCPDGVLQVRGRDPFEGREAIRAFLGGVATDADERSVDVRRVARHHVTNTRFTSLNPDEARVDSYFAVFTELGLDHHGRYRDVFVPVDDDWLIRHRRVTTDWARPDSAMATPDLLG